MTSSNVKTVAFFGASGGVGLAALQHTLNAGHKCIALCRTPSKLTAVIPESTPNLKIIQGDAQDATAVSKCLLADDGNFVDIINSTIGSRPKLSFSVLEDPHICEKASKTLIESISRLRSAGVTGHPHIVTFSTTGLSKFGRDYPLSLYVVYAWLLKVPHDDKTIMEDTFVNSGEPFTIVRGSLLYDGGATTKKVRVGIEDVKTGRESEEIGYIISREDAGRWVAENLILRQEKVYLNKIAMITT
ncbi:hypothetical protein N7495_003329 [Penicillium taxi]|uniref:uncharacterized protein n=1 Tax=Penicillium taxi TaxID=168475 RepID=UPI0025453E94|nr:uncharacterized protein N7495_003329 [Penicillium taxi]KAJ5902801.1 hypothetical protein N7495_003329 [Penicillium taxi]